MADFGALSELHNQQRPGRRFDKIYGKKKPAMAYSRAMHFHLFGGGDENHIVDKMDELKLKHDRDTPVQPVQEHPSPPKKQPAEHDPRLRGRRKALPSRKMAALTPERSQALTPLLGLIQREVKDFQEFGRSIGKKYICTKLGEGAYADVFKLHPKDFEQATDSPDEGGAVIKVIPFNIDKSTEDDIVDLESITREVRVFLTLTPLYGFAQCRGVEVVSGKYPDVLLEAFHLYKSTDPTDAINPDPNDTTPPDQLYVIIEMSNAGTPISKIKKPSAFQTFDIFWKTAMTLAHAEDEAEFEHRDLHNGNVCFKPRTRDGPIDATEELIGNMTAEPDVTLGLSNLEVTVIDYTLSRAHVGNDSSGGDPIVFDPIVYWEQNDIEGRTEAEKRQYDTYRTVRDWAKTTEICVQARAELDGVELEPMDKYMRFLPKSNVMWLGYLLADMLSRNKGEGRAACLPGSSRAAKRLQMNIWRTLEQVEGYINGTTPTLMPESARELLDTAVDQKWLTPADIAAFKSQVEE
ncbi:uncharacterized protein Z518_03855 [Rhinocladiella mackenziei CBS 650.93]|uniref:Protein kinase domain-containing protein n=1 Tax=Rhinocladiella mackenziei CBS 650.93 TaxID=1442369 RepID=A0A0D2FUW9_9EURO|nr:uncharacterized protein Z518_03855 [Rhinocladiella mackenziei CBS 650.93]KIX05882.1 hypothetical protein Z518_03855 [Rhinocladiella mackenziei CBS 650.93]